MYSTQLEHFKKKALSPSVLNLATVDVTKRQFDDLSVLGGEYGSIIAYTYEGARPFRHL